MSEAFESDASAPRVTIAIPVFNGENFIATAIRSALAQSFGDLELIVTDNASTDRTEEICRAFAAEDNRLRYVRQEKNLGAAANYNKGLALARGQYFKWMAHDDWISEAYIARCVAALDADPGLALAHGAPREMLDEATPYPHSAFHGTDWSTGGPVERFAQAMRLERTCHAIFGLYRRDVLLKTTWHRPYYTSDRNLVAETALFGRFQEVDGAIFYNRKHDGQSMAQSGDRLALNTWQDTSNRKKYATQNLSRLSHFFEIAGRHPDIASASALTLASAGLLFNPRKLLVYLDEAIHMAAPGLYGPAREALRRAYRRINPFETYVKS